MLSADQITIIEEQLMGLFVNLCLMNNQNRANTWVSMIVNDVADGYFDYDSLLDAIVEIMRRQKRNKIYYATLREKAIKLYGEHKKAA